ncbi:hypothetical protein Hanom_Chr05g00396761 [Helianthus anomalus]
MNPACKKQHSPHTVIRFNRHIVYNLFGFVQQPSPTKKVYHTRVVFTFRQNVELRCHLGNQSSISKDKIMKSILCL